MRQRMNGISLAPIGVLLLVACLIAMLSRRLGLPYIVGLVVAGFLIALLPNSPDLPLSRDLIFNILLAAAGLRSGAAARLAAVPRRTAVDTGARVPGVAIAAAVVAAGMHWIVGWSWIGAALFGVLIAATDPVSVIASFREMGAAARLDGRRIGKPAQRRRRGGRVRRPLRRSPRVRRPARQASFRHSCGRLAAGSLIGLAVSAAILLIVGRTDDPLVEITLTTIAAYGSFLIAEHFHASGIISALAAGLLVGKLGWDGALSDAGPRPRPLARGNISPSSPTASCSSSSA